MAGAGLVRFVTIEGIDGSAFADTLLGNELFNQFSGGAGNDYIDGRGGFDFADYRTATAAVVVNLLAGTATGGAGNDTLVSIEGVWGSRFNDLLTGDLESNTLIGGMGNDTLNGGDGDDLLIGHGGAFLHNETNYLNGGAGFDRISFAQETTVAIPNYPVFNVNVNLTTGVAQFAVGTRTITNYLTSIEGVTGGTGRDTIIGDNNANELIGGGGVDWIDGGGGDDYIDGGTEMDTLIGGAGRDTLSYLSSNQAVVVSLATHISSTSDTISGFENLMGSLMNDTLTGDSGANELYGADGSDVLIGGDGDDLLFGGAGGDTMTGGSGSDTFVFLSADRNTYVQEDLITDLTADDFIDLSGVDADVLLAGDQAFTFVEALTGVAGQATLLFDSTSNRTLLSLDVDGDGVADFAIRMVGDQSAFTGFVL